MRINIAPPGPPAMMEMGLFARPTEELRNFQAVHNAQALQQFQAYGQAGVEFFNQSQQAFQDFYQKSGMEAVQTLIDVGEIALTTGSHFFFPRIETVEELQQMQPEYQPLLMANPIVRSYYLTDRIEGYPDTYDNVEGDAIKETHNPWRAATTGIGNWEYEDPEVHGYYFRESIDDPMDINLTLKEKLNVFRAWAEQNYALSQGVDPTSVDGFKVRNVPEN